MSYSRIPTATAGTAIKADYARDVANCVNEVRLKKRIGQRISNTSYGTKVDFDKETQKEIELSTTQAFNVRWYQKDLDDSRSGEWQIYLPYGCVAIESNGVTQSCMPVNDDATDRSGENIFQWYKIADPKDADAVVTTYNGYVAKEWTVYLHIKPWPRMKAGTISEDEEFGRDFNCVPVATIYTVDMKDGDKGTMYHGSIKMRDGNVSLKRDTSGAFSVKYEIGNKNKNSKVKVKLVQCVLNVGRGNIVIDDVDITDKEEVWLKVSHGSEDFSLEVINSKKESNDDQTVFKIYELDKNVITLDLHDSMPTLNFYTNVPDKGDK